MLLIGSHKALEAQKKIIELVEKEFDREINTIDMTEAEFEKKKEGSEFVKNIFHDKYIQII